MIFIGSKIYIRYMWKLLIESTTKIVINSYNNYINSYMKCDPFCKKFDKYSDTYI